MQPMERGVDHYRLPKLPNQSLQPTANPLRGLPAAELSR